MPYYLFENVETNEFREIFFHMNDVKIYNGENGLEINLWERRYYSPQAAVDTKINAESAADFVNKTGKKRGTLGDLFDASKEAGQRREQLMGKDFEKDKNIKKWKEARQRPSGTIPKHPSEVKKVEIVAE